MTQTELVLIVLSIFGVIFCVAIVCREVCASDEDFIEDKDKEKEEKK